MTSQIWWFLSRGSGIVAWLTLGASCALGIAMASRAVRAARPAWMLDLHRWLGALAVITTGVHVGALVPDNYVHFGWKEILLPGGSGWRTSAVTWGVLALYLLSIVQLSSLLMKRLPRRLWHSIHLLSYVLFGFATLHGALAGTDRENRVYVLAVVLIVTAVAVGLVLRLTRRPARAHRRSTPHTTTPPPAPTSRPEPAVPAR